MVTIPPSMVMLAVGPKVKPVERKGTPLPLPDPGLGPIGGDAKELKVNPELFPLNAPGGLMEGIPVAAETSKLKKPSAP